MAPPMAVLTAKMEEAPRRWERHRPATLRQRREACCSGAVANCGGDSGRREGPAGVVLFDESKAFTTHDSWRPCFVAACTSQRVLADLQCSHLVAFVLLFRHHCRMMIHISTLHRYRLSELIQFWFWVIESHAGTTRSSTMSYVQRSLIMPLSSNRTLASLFLFVLDFPFSWKVCRFT